MRIRAPAWPLALAASIALSVAAGVPAHGQVEPTGVVLESTGVTGGLRIVNTSAAPITIARAIEVEAYWGGSWKTQRTEFNAVAICRSGTTAATVQLSPGQVLTVVPWRGYSCSGQCQGSCRHNIYVGGGDAPFRFVVTQIPGGRRVGPVFTMPRRPRGD